MRFIAADFSSIEGRVTAWLAGEAVTLAEFLVKRLHQSSCCVVGEHHTAWLTRRGETDA